MALVTEDGTGRADAESYCSVAFADTYHDARGRAATWTALQLDVKERCLRLATDYMLQAYREAWAGQRATFDQALDWPRAWVPKKDAPSGYASHAAYYASDAVPVEVQKACAELAFKAATGTDLAPDIGPQVTSKTVGPISVTYAAGARQQVVYQAVGGLLAPLLAHSGSQIRVVRS
ncbi:DnaT-like ssDNA-binding protein [Caldimonas brevitalea]|uniref:Phage protein n=1 Tax=Caldimonas brevitalea TaxID=413882 RepID=A0A0G3BHD4_9BURK|nr:DnaT-like ssDNA-binding protein [Caldimonas brevitalea]AKJ28834.1 phage protein [Caldimonas brevitalea]